MNTEMSPRIRSFVSGLAAIAMTTLLATTLVESMKPALTLGSSERSTPVNTAALDIRGDTTLA